jgi:hypothetical protein
MDDNELRSMVACRVSLDAMARMLGKPKRAVAQRLAEIGCEIPGGFPIDTLTLFRLWNDSRMKISDIAKHFGVRVGVVYRAARRYGLPNRTGIFDERSSDHAENDDEEAASQSSLRLAPSTERLAAPIRDSWSDEVRYLRRVQHVQPLTYDRCGLG